MGVPRSGRLLLHCDRMCNTLSPVFQPSARGQAIRKNESPARGCFFSGPGLPPAEGHPCTADEKRFLRREPPQSLRPGQNSAGGRPLQRQHILLRVREIRRRVCGGAPEHCGHGRQHPDHGADLGEEGKCCRALHAVHRGQHPARVGVSGTNRRAPLSNGWRRFSAGGIHQPGGVAAETAGLSYLTAAVGYLAPFQAKTPPGWRYTLV